MLAVRRTEPDDYGSRFTLYIISQVPGPDISLQWNWASFPEIMGRVSNHDCPQASRLCRQHRCAALRGSSSHHKP